MRAYEILLVNQTNGVERIGSVVATSVVEAQQLLLERWNEVHPDGYIPGLGECDEKAGITNIYFRFFTVRIIDTTKERAEFDDICAALTGNHSVQQY